MKNKLLTIFVVGIAMLFVTRIANAISWSNQTASTVTAVNIGTLGGSYTEGRDINNAGQVTGSSSTAGDSTFRAFIWSPGDTMRDLGTLGGYPSYGHGINNAGQVTGNGYFNTPNGAASHGFIWSPGGTLTALNQYDGSGRGGMGYSSATGINNAGQVVGEIGNQTVVWSNNGATRLALDTLEQYGSYGHGINDSGQVTGISNVLYNGRYGITILQRAVVWSPSGVITDLGTLGGYSSSYGIAINNAGQVTGSFTDTDGDGSHAFIWSPGGIMRDLDILGGDSSFGLGINNAAQIVGSSSSSAFVWEDGTMYDLNSFVDFDSSGEFLMSAYAINDFSQIVAHSTLGKTYVLTPSAASPVPVPGAFWLLGSGLAGLAGLRRKKKA